MRFGKLENSELESLILSKFIKTRPESLTVPRVGEDCAALDFQGDLIVMSMDPITSAGDKSLGLLSVHVNCNDAVCMGAEPVGLLVTLLLPPDYPTEGIGHIADDLAAAAQVAHVDILGGHTEFTDAVARPITCTSVVARMPRGRKLPGLQVGDALVMTKSAGLEGSAILASEHADKLSNLSPTLLKEATGYYCLLSVVPEGKVALEHGCHAMHDVTEGGVLGAVWEICYAAGLGLRLDKAAVPVTKPTWAIAQAAGIDPLRLLGSGSLLIGCSDGQAMVEALRKADIPAAVIGAVTESGFVATDGTPIHPPREDALYDAFLL
jgi:hydrogenase maturation factor